jgi:hypothetical protein
LNPIYTGEPDVFTVVKEVKDEPPKKADRAYIPEKNKTGGIIGDPIIPPLPRPPPPPLHSIGTSVTFPVVV